MTSSFTLRIKIVGPKVNSIKQSPIIYVLDNLLVDYIGYYKIIAYPIRKCSNREFLHSLF